MKTKEELNAIKEEVEALNRKLSELTGDELAQVTGGLSKPSLAAFEGGPVSVDGPSISERAVGFHIIRHLIDLPETPQAADLRNNRNN